MEKVATVKDDCIIENGLASTTEKQIGNTVYIITSECSPTATETLKQKLERILKCNVMETKK